MRINKPRVLDFIVIKRKAIERNIRAWFQRAYGLLVLVNRE